MKRVMITREMQSSEKMLKDAYSLGIDTVFLPLIKTSAIDAVFSLDTYDYAIITSPTAACYFSKYASLLDINNYIVVGRSTAQELESLKLASRGEVLYPESHYFQEIIMLFNKIPIEGVNIVSPGAKVRIADFSKYFLSRNAFYDRVDIYETTSVVYSIGYVNRFIQDNDITDIAFFSPSAVKSFFDNLLYLPRNIRYFAIGTSTANELKSKGIDSTISDNQTAESVLRKIYEMNY